MPGGEKCVGVYIYIFFQWNRMGVIFFFYFQWNHVHPTHENVDGE